MNKDTEKLKEKAIKMRFLCSMEAGVIMGGTSMEEDEEEVEQEGENKMELAEKKGTENRG